MDSIAKNVLENLGYYTARSNNVAIWIFRLLRTNIGLDVKRLGTNMALVSTLQPINYLMV